MKDEKAASSGIKFKMPEPINFVCKKGHVRLGQPFTLYLTIEGAPLVLRTKSLCPVCYVAWLDAQFGEEEVDADLEEERAESLAAAGAEALAEGKAEEEEQY